MLRAPLVPETIFVLSSIKDKENIKDNLVFEKANSERRTGTFPHLYGKLTTQDVINTWRLDRCGFELPKEVLVESEKK